MKESEGITIKFIYPDSPSVDYYKEARDGFLREKFTTETALAISDFRISFTISSTAKNGPLVYKILEVIPQDMYVIDVNNIEVKISSERVLINYIEQIWDLLTVIHSWKSTVISINGIEIAATTEIRYVLDFLFEKHNIKSIYLGSSIESVRKKYNRRKKSSSRVQRLQNCPTISRISPKAALDIVLEKYIEKYGYNKSIESFIVSEYDKVIVIEDSLVVDFRLLPRSWQRDDDEYVKDWDFPMIYIQELTHNDLYKFNFADFKRCFCFDYIGIDFLAFHGVHYYRPEVDNYIFISKSLPELKLKQRNEEYLGEPHQFIVLRMEDAYGNTAFGIGETKGKVHTFILKLCKELEEKNSRSLELNGASCLPFGENREFIDAFLSWKGEKKRWRLEEKFSYYYFERTIKEDIDLFSIPGEIIKSAKDGAYDGCEFGTYSKPLNRWKSEELVYNITKKLYKDYQVIYQYKPFFLTTEKGNMSYDIYICGLKVAIEYQGKQHFEPVDYFGGADNFKKQQERDKLKAERSKKNGVKLIYINYWEDITPTLVKERIEEAIKIHD